MMDIHSHIIYGIDDGAKTLDDSIAIIKLAYIEGIRKMIATPHYNKTYFYTNVDLEKNFNEVLDRTKDEKINMQIYLGHEAYLDEYLLGALLEGQCKTLASSKYVLIELSNALPIGMARHLLFDIMMNGFIPIIAHCERLMLNKTDENKILALKSMGCYLQVNSNAIITRKRWLRKILFKRLKDHTISFISSDAHDIRYRKPLSKAAYKKVCKKLGKEIADKVFKFNAEKIINGDLIN